MRYHSLADYARHAFPDHVAVGGHEVPADGRTVVAHYTEPRKAERVLETAGHEFGHLEMSFVKLEVRERAAARRTDDRPRTVEELFVGRDEPPAWIGVVAVLVVVAVGVTALRLLLPVIGTIPAMAASLGGVALGSSVGFVVAHRVAQWRRWHRHDADPHPMALAAIRTSGISAVAALVALMERFEPESVRVLDPDGWHVPSPADGGRKGISPS